MFSTTRKWILCIETRDLLMLLGSFVSFFDCHPSEVKIAIGALLLRLQGWVVGYGSWKVTVTHGGKHWHMMAEVPALFLPHLPRPICKWNWDETGGLATITCVLYIVCWAELSTDLPALSWEENHKTFPSLHCQQKVEIKDKIKASPCLLFAC